MLAWKVLLRERCLSQPRLCCVLFPYINRRMHDANEAQQEVAQQRFIMKPPSFSDDIR